MKDGDLLKLTVPIQASNPQPVIANNQYIGQIPARATTFLKETHSHVFLHCLQLHGACWSSSQKWVIRYFIGQSTVTDFWEKMKPVIAGIRKEENNQNYYEYFEYLYNEAKKREKLQSKT
jgi:hypothetical protein